MIIYNLYKQTTYQAKGSCRILSHAQSFLSMNKICLSQTIYWCIMLQLLSTQNECIIPQENT